MTTQATPHTVAVVGAGFSGAVTAMHLMTLPQAGALRVLLVNRSGSMARGLAYGTDSREHLLNVPAGNMSALAGDPDNFLRYAKWADPSVDASSFVPRRLYGAYLEALLHAAAHRASDDRRLDRWVGEVESVRPLPTDGGNGEGGPAMRLTMDDGRSVDADHVVLAFGHFMPSDPPLADRSFYASDRYVRDPWCADALDRVPADAPVLLVGSGLTAVDVALTLARRPRSAPIVCLSRRGLVPASHRATRGLWSAEAAAALASRLGRGVRADLRALRATVREHTAAGGDWRDVIGALRPHTPGWWRGLPLSERSRFLRQLQPYWDAARHRCAPAPFARFQALRSSGQLQLLAGRIQAIDDGAIAPDAIDPDRTAHDGSPVRVTWRPRGETADRVLTVGAVVNCTGPSADLQRVRSPLLQQLLAEGLIRPDALRMGVRVDDEGALLGEDGAPTPGLHYVGPLLRARDWEATAVPELRVHAERLARRLVDIMR